MIQFAVGLLLWCHICNGLLVENTPKPKIWCLNGKMICSTPEECKWYPHIQAFSDKSLIYECEESHGKIACSPKGTFVTVCSSYQECGFMQAFPNDVKCEISWNTKPSSPGETSERHESVDEDIHCYEGNRICSSPEECGWISNTAAFSNKTLKYECEQVYGIMDCAPIKLEKAVCSSHEACGFSQTFKDNVICEISWEQKHGSIHVNGMEGQPITLSAEIPNVAVDIVQWSLNGTVIASCEEDSPKTRSQSVELDCDTFSLTIPALQTDLSGLYKCAVNNQDTAKSYLLTVKVQNGTPAPMQDGTAAPGLGSSGTVTGIVIGVILAIAAVSILVWYRRRRPRPVAKNAVHLLTEVRQVADPQTDKVMIRAVKCEELILMN